MKLNISIAGVFLYFLSVQIISAQDIHMSMYHFDRLQINPALTGMFNGDKQVTLFHKQQYFSVPVDYLTFSGSYDQKFLKDVNAKGFFSGGIFFNYDQAGDAKLSWLSLTLNGSYTRALNSWLFVGVGAYVGGGQRSFDEAGVTWDNMWTGDIINESLGSGESFDNTNFFWPDAGTGLNVRIQGKDRTKVDVGFATFHINQPAFSFYKSDDIRLPVRLTYSVLGVLKLGSRFDLFANGLVEDQSSYSEYLVGGGVIFHISTKKAREMELHLGFGGRIDDALTPMVAFGYDGWKAGFSYEVNTSPFKIATDENAGPEFFVTYTYKKLRPLEQTRVCSIF